MTPTKRCLVCPNTSRKNPAMIFVQMPHPKNEYNSRRAWFAVYEHILDYNEHLDSYLCSDHFDLANDTSNLEYYMARRMKKLLFKPRTLPKPLPGITPRPRGNQVIKYSSVIKQEPEENVDTDEEDEYGSYLEEQCDEVRVKEEPLDIHEHGIWDESDIKLEPEDEEEQPIPSPPPLVPAVTLLNTTQAMHMQAQTDCQQPQTQQPLVINSFQVANPQLRNRLQQLAAEGRLRVVNVSNSDKTSTTPTLAVVGTDDMSANSTGVIQTTVPLVRVPGPPQLVQRPLQGQAQVRQMMVHQNQGQRVRLISVQGQGGVQQLGQVVNLQPMTTMQSTNSTTTFQTPNESIPRHQFILPRNLNFLPSTTTPTPSLVPLPMRSVFACGKCTELFYTTADRDKHIETKHPGSLYVGTNGKTAGTNAKTAGTKSSKGHGKHITKDTHEEKEYKCEICKVTVPFTQKSAHLGTHETFKCVTCHQTLEKRVYASHMMSHIEVRPYHVKTKTTSASRSPRSNVIPKPSQSTHAQDLAKTSKHIPKILQRQPKPLHGTKRAADDTVSIIEVKKATKNVHAEIADFEENLNEYLIPTEASLKKKLTARSSDSSVVKEIGPGMEMYFTYRCKVCTKTFRSNDELQAHHERIHKGPSAYVKCAYCDDDVLRPKMQQHVRKKHPKNYLCRYCHGTFPFHHEYILHLKTVHKDAFRLTGAQSVQYDRQKLRRAAARRRVRSNVHVKSEVQTPITQRVPGEEEDMDYDEDYPLAMLIPLQNGDNNRSYSPQENDVDLTGINAVDEDDELDDTPDYVDITQYNDMD